MASERKILQDNLKRVLLREYVMKETQRAGFGGLDIQRTPMGTRITLFAERPGIVIGRRGASIKELTANIDGRFSLDNPQIEVEEVGNPSLNAQIMAEKLSSALERGWHFRRAGHSTLRRIMESGAKGALIKISGKLTSQRHRTTKFKAGHIKYCGEPKNTFVRVGFATAKVKKGIIGVTVWITDPNAKFPDEVEVQAPIRVEEVELEPEAEEVVEEAVKTLTKSGTEKVVTSERVEKKLKKIKKVAEEIAEDVEVAIEEEGEVDEEPEEVVEEKPKSKERQTPKGAESAKGEPSPKKAPPEEKAQDKGVKKEG